MMTKSEMIIPGAIMLVFAVLIGGRACGIAPEYSHGERTGVVTKFSRKGIVFKSWEGELNQGGMRRESDGEGGTNLVANVIGFNVSDEKTVEKVRQAHRGGKPVSLEYQQWFIAPMTINNSRVVVGVHE